MVNKLIESLTHLGFICDERIELFQNPKLNYKYIHCYSKHTWEFNEIDIKFIIVEDPILNCVRFQDSYIENKEKQNLQICVSYNELKSVDRFIDIYLQQIVDKFFHFQYKNEKYKSFWVEGYELNKNI